MSIDAAINWAMNSQLVILGGNCAICVGGFSTACKVQRWKCNYIIKSFYPIIVQTLLLIQYLFSGSGWTDNLKIGITVAMTIGIIHEMATLLAQCIYKVKTHIEQKVIKKIGSQGDDGIEEGISDNPLDQSRDEDQNNRPLNRKTQVEPPQGPKRYSRRKQAVDEQGENTESTFLPAKDTRNEPERKVKIRGANTRKVSQMNVQYVGQDEDTNY